METRNIVVSSLIQLASTDLNDELKSNGVSDLVGNDKELASAIAEMEKESRKEAMKAAAQSIINLSKLTDAAITSKVDRLRQLRAEEKAIKTEIDALNKARAYGSETRNYLPLMVQIGVPIPKTVKFSELMIPESFASKKTTKK